MRHGLWREGGSRPLVVTVASDFCVAGVDVGSTLTKVVVYDGDLLASTTGPTEANYVRTATRLLGQALEQAGQFPDRLAYVVATGYGRRQVPFADRQITEITCHARGVRGLFPRARTIIDIGGQDAKGIKLSPAGKVINFVMNDKCAAGTGRFLDVMAALLGLSIDELGERGLGAPRRVGVSSVCTVFAQQEVAERLAEGVPVEEVLAGLHDALASRIHRMVRRLSPEADVILTGGGAKNRSLVRTLEERLGISVVVPPEPLITGALGAALLAREAIAQGERPRRTPLTEEGALAAGGVPAEDHGRSRLAAFPARSEMAGRTGQLRLPTGESGTRSPAVGLDVGSLFTKAVVVDGREAAFAVLPSRGNYLRVAEEALDRIVGSAGIPRAALRPIVATGLGASKLPFARQASEISCLAKGIARLFPEANLAIDIGGQATRVIRLAPGGLVKDFAVSGQCAAGSARMLDVIAHLFGVEADELGPLSLRSGQPATFSAGCAVFAETEAISLLAQGTPREDLLAGIHRSLAGKIIALARATGPLDSCALSGGGARDLGLVERMREAVGRVMVPSEPTVVAALGAALLAAEGDG
ncbi:MAG: acyl-CoA dehydratase activase [Candidatus Methylomirabilia bacterium]